MSGTSSRREFDRVVPHLSLAPRTKPCSSVLAGLIQPRFSVFAGFALRFIKQLPALQRTAKIRGRRHQPHPLPSGRSAVRFGDVVFVGQALTSRYIPEGLGGLSP